MKEILFFSNNVSKIEEINKLFEKLSINILSLNNFNFNKELKETGKTFVENAKIKSDYGYNNFRIPCFADDSGICIEALGYKPGIFSRRFLESFPKKNDCFKYILNKTKIKNKAYFKTSICLTIKKNYIISFEGVINGRISKYISGRKGFGYDPIFIPNGFSKTFAEMTIKQKNTISHRSIAINKLINFLVN